MYECIYAKVSRSQETPRLQQPDPIPREGLAESFDGMRGEHRFPGSFDDSGVAGILFEGVEINRMPAGPIQHKAGQLFEDLHHRLAPRVLSHSAEKTLQVGINPDMVQIVNEQGKSGTGAQSSWRFFGCINLAFALILRGGAQ